MDFFNVLHEPEFPPYPPSPQRVASSPHESIASRKDERHAVRGSSRDVLDLIEGRRSNGDRSVREMYEMFRSEDIMPSKVFAAAPSAPVPPPSADEPPQIPQSHVVTHAVPTEPLQDVAAGETLHGDMRALLQRAVYGPRYDDPLLNVILDNSLIDDLASWHLASFAVPNDVCEALVLHIDHDINAFDASVRPRIQTLLCAARERALRPTPTLVPPELPSREMTACERALTYADAQAASGTTSAERTEYLKAACTAFASVGVSSERPILLSRIVEHAATLEPEHALPVLNAAHAHLDRVTLPETRAAVKERLRCAAASHGAILKLKTALIPAFDRLASAAETPHDAAESATPISRKRPAPKAAAIRRPLRVRVRVPARAGGA